MRERLRAFRDAGVGTLLAHADGLHPRRAHRAAARCSPSSPRRRRSRGRAAAALLPRRVRRPGPRVPDARARDGARPPAATRSTLETWGQLAGRTSRRRGWRSPPRPSSRSSRDRGRAARALRGGRAVDRGVTRPADRRLGRRRRRPRHPHARAGGVGRARGRARGRRSSPTSTPHPPPGFAALLARRAAGPDRGRARALWRGARAARSRAGCAAGATSSTTCAGGSGCPPLDHALRRAVASSCRSSPRSRSSSTRATWRPWTHVVGPLLWEPPADDVELPPGDAPLVARRALDRAGPRAPSAARRRSPGWRAMPVRVLATWNRRPRARAARVPANARLVEWISYARTMPHADVVVSHGGHGTLVRALASGAAGRRRPRRGRPERERGAGRLGRRRRPRARGG